MVQLKYIIYGALLVVILLVGYMLYSAGYNNGKSKAESVHAAEALAYDNAMTALNDRLATSITEADLLRSEERVEIKEKYRDIIKEVVKYVPVDNCSLDDDFMRIYQDSLPASATSESE